MLVFMSDIRVKPRLIAVALLEQERSLQPARQEAQFRLRPVAHCRHQNQIKQQFKIRSTDANSVVTLIIIHAVCFTNKY